jgi:hypothetical protein
MESNAFDFTRDPAFRFLVVCEPLGLRSRRETGRALE